MNPLRATRGLPRGDVVFAVGLAALGVVDVFVGGWRGPTAVNAVAVPLMALALAWRRRHPLGVLAFVVACFTALSAAFGAPETSTAVFILVAAVFSAAAHGSNPVATVALSVVVAIVETTLDPLIHTFGDAAWSIILVTLTLGAGFGMRARTEALERGQELMAAAAAEEERKRIARELHDIISHSLGVLVLQAGAAEQVVERDPERAREVLRSIRATGQEAIGEMGTLFGLIRGEPVATREPQPSLADVSKLVEKMHDAGLDVRLDVEGEARPLPAALELSAFRIVQEGLTNALKHAGPGHASVILRYADEELEIEVADDGSSVNGNGQGSRRGLAGAGERVALFGGRLDAGPRPDGGWTLRAGFPLER
ncbi:MAG TPA: sensor histidine kinase [Thermoleophilaceae bacterium]|nr:sensor histidine kinase [Thermoleophilaceae bacterium]